jgi:hypothetical protein
MPSGCNIETAGYGSTLWAWPSRAVFDRLDFVGAAPTLINRSLPHLIRFANERAGQHRER